MAVGDCCCCRCLLLLLPLLLLLLLLHADSGAGTVAFDKCTDLNLDVREGAPLQAVCRANVQSETDSSNKYHWEYRSKQGRHSFTPFSPTERFKYNPSGDIGDLHIRSLDRSNDGNQFLCARGSGSSMVRCERGATVNVFWMNTNTSVVRLEPKRRLQFGDRVQLECRVESSEPPSVVRWFLNGRILCNATNCSRLDGVSISSTRLAINSFTPQLAGVYHCYVEATGGKILTRNPLPVLPAGAETQFGSPVAFGWVKSEILLRSARPSNASSWLWLTHFGLENVSTKRLDVGQLSTDGWLFSQGSWRSRKTKLGFADKYNDARYFFLRRQYVEAAGTTLSFLYEIIPTRNSALDGNKHFEPPVSHDTYNLVTEGARFVQRVYLPHGESEWVPQPAVQWRDPAGRAISSGDGTVSVQRGTDLVIERATLQHAGTYRVTVRNFAATETKDVKLIVTFVPVMDTMMDTKESELTRWDGDPLNVSCPQVRVAPWPATNFSWVRETGSKLATFVGPESYIDRDRVWVDRHNGTLHFKYLLPSDEGKFKCRASTRLGPEMPWELESSNFRRPAEQDSGTVTLRVKRRLRLCPGLSSIVLLEQGMQDRIRCEWQGDERPRMQWLRLLKGSQRFQPVLPGSGFEFNSNKTEMKFNYVDESYAGQYQVKAENKHEVVSRNFTVAVGSKPRIREVPGNRSVLLGEPLSLRCLASGRPQLKVTWRFRSADGSQTVDFDSCGRRCEVAGRVTSNGTLQIPRIGREHDGVYRCTAQVLFSRRHSRPVRLTVQASAGTRTSMAKTIAIVVSCAVGYLGLIVFLSVYCTLRMQRRRQKRSINEQHLQQQQLQQQQQQQQLQPAPNSLFNEYCRGSDVTHYEPAGRPIPPEYRSLLCTGRDYSPQRQTADRLDMLPGCQFDSCSGISSSFPSTYGRLHTNTPANSVVELTIERVCRMHQADRKRLQYRPGILGRGLFGTVRTGCLNGASVVVKELATDDEKQHSEFVKQIEMFSKCDHDYVTKLMGVCSDAGPPLIILEYCDNGNLFDLLAGLKKRNDQLPEDCQLRMCLQVAQALEHIHSLGFVHADLGCRSILVTPEFNLKLSNLGPCLDRFSGQYSYSGSNTLMAIRWLPPEAVLHDQCGIKADVWSFGIVVMEIFTMGRKPYPHLSDADVLVAAAQPNFRPELPNTVPLQLGPLLDHCWSPTPDRRPTAGQIVAKVAELTHDLADV